jgi:hypothetical protein
MSRLFSSICLILIVASVAFSQTPTMLAAHDDHDDKAPVQAGYAVVTNIGAGGAPVVFETFGYRGFGGTTQAGVLPPNLTTNALLFVDSEGRLGKNVGVAMVNPNGSDAAVSLTLRKADGTMSPGTGTVTVIVPSHHQVSKMVTDLVTDKSMIPSDVVGTLAITSVTTGNISVVEPVSVIGLRFRGMNFSTLPVTDLSPFTGPLPVIASSVGGTGAVLLPQFAAGGGWATELVIVNGTTSELDARVDLFKQDGTPLTTALNGTTASTFNVIIKPNGVFVLAPRDNDGDDDF